MSEQMCILSDRTQDYLSCLLYVLLIKINVELYFLGNNVTSKVEIKGFQITFWD